jgi:L-arabinose isomerase
MQSNVKVDLFGVGLNTYWPQFSSLLDRLTGYRDEICTRMTGLGTEAVNAGMVDYPEKAQQAAEYLNRENVGIAFLFISTYARLSIQMTVKHGPVPLLSVCESCDGIFLLVAEGDSIPGPVLEIGNTNSRYRFPVGSRTFIDQWSKAGPSHHSAIGVGHVAATIEKLAFLLDIPMIQVC